MPRFELEGCPQYSVGLEEFLGNGDDQADGVLGEDIDDSGLASGLFGGEDHQVALEGFLRA